MKKNLKVLLLELDSLTLIQNSVLNKNHFLDIKRCIQQHVERSKSNNLVNQGYCVELILDQLLHHFQSCDSSNSKFLAQLSLIETMLNQEIRVQKELREQNLS